MTAPCRRFHVDSEVVLPVEQIGPVVPGLNNTDSCLYPNVTILDKQPLDLDFCVPQGQFCATTLNAMDSTRTEKQKYKYIRMTCREITQTGNTDKVAVLWAAMPAGTRFLP